MVIIPLAPDQTIAQMWSSGARGGASWYNAPEISWSVLAHCLMVEGSEWSQTKTCTWCSPDTGHGGQWLA